MFSPIVPLSLSLLLTSLLLSSGAVAVQNVPPTVSGSIQMLGHTSDPDFSSDFASDGGAGGKVNGFNVITLSDASIPSIPGFLVHTAYAYFGVRDANDPTAITIIGDYERDPHFYLLSPDGSGDGVIESDSSDAVRGNDFAPGPNTMMVPLGNGTGGVNAWTVYNYANNTPLYNTLIEYNVVDPNTLIAANQNIPAQRTVDQLFFADQPLYGTDGFAADADFLYLMALDNTGYKLSRVAIADRTDKTQYSFWHSDSQQWNNQIHTLNDGTGNLLTPHDYGGSPPFGTDIYFSAHFQTWLISYSAADAFGGKYFTFAYSSSGAITGPYVDVGNVFNPPQDAACNNTGLPPYLLHSHPGWDESGKTLLFSWISCDHFTDMGIITWE